MSSSSRASSPTGRCPSGRRAALVLVIGAVLALSGCARGRGPAERHHQADPPAKARLHVFLLAGQSNMAGRGDVEPEDREPLPSILALDRAGEWRPAVDPLHWDKPSAGVGLGRAFARAYLDAHPGVTVGLVPAACGGSPIASWQPGRYFDQTQSHPYDDALARLRRALEDGTLRGILWHQGESDRSPELAPQYEAALIALIQRFRRDLEAPRVPFLIGQLGQFPGAGPWDEHAWRVDRAQREAAARVPFSAFVPSSGLTSKADNLHFDAPSLREFGRRYAAALLALESRRSAPTSYPAP